MFASKAKENLKTKENPLDQMLFVTVTEKGTKFRISKMWLNNGKVVSLDATPETIDLDVFGANPTVALHNSEGIMERGQELLAKFNSSAKDWKAISEKGLENFDQFLTKNHDAMAHDGKVLLPYDMYGEFGPSVTALLCGSKVTVTYSDSAKQESAERVKQVLQCFNAKNVGTLKMDRDTFGTFNDLHYDWRGGDIPSLFRGQIAFLAENEPRKLTFFNALYLAASSKDGRKPKDEQPAQPLRFCIWIRNAKSNVKKNTSIELLNAIFEEMALTTSLYWEKKKVNPSCEVILLGDPGLVEPSEARQTLLSLLGKQFKTDNNNNLDVSVVDLRGFADRQNGPFKDLYAKKGFLPDFEYYTVEGVGDYISYLDQWLVYYYLATQKKPKFVVGAESGNMDTLGYTGTPVISIDPNDLAADLPVSMLIDRIGQYCCMTPLWQLVNGNAPDEASRQLFREYLRGAMLRFLYSEPHEKSKPEDKSGKSEQPDRPALTQEQIMALWGEIQNGSQADQKALAQIGQNFQVIDVAGDGNCLFRAISQARVGKEYMHSGYRVMASKWAAENFSLVQLCAASGVNFATVNDYYIHMSTQAKDATDTQHYGGYLEVVAFAQRCDMSINIYSPNAPVIMVNPGKNEAINLYFANGNHYKVLLPKQN